MRRSRRRSATGASYSVDLRAWRGDRPIWVIARGTAVRGSRWTYCGIARDRSGHHRAQTDRRGTAGGGCRARMNSWPLWRTNCEIPWHLCSTDWRSCALPTVTSAPAIRARELMGRQLAHLVRLVDDLLDVSRVSQGKVSMQKTLTSLQNVVALALGGIKATHGRGQPQLWMCSCRTSRFFCTSMTHVLPKCFRTS